MSNQLKNHLKNNIYRSLEIEVENLMNDLHSKYNTESGDIDPQQELQLSSATEQMAEIMAEQIAQNMPSDFDPEVDKLRELSGI